MLRVLLRWEGASAAQAGRQASVAPQSAQVSMHSESFFNAFLLFIGEFESLKHTEREVNDLGMLTSGGM